MTTPDAPVKAGDTLDGKYRVEKVLGTGGMGVVVQARHVELNRRVALKFMLPSAAMDGESAARFIREARAASQLRSEHSVRVDDTGRLKNGSPYMVMELLVGRDIGELLETSGRLPIADAVDYVVQACEALAEAHAMRIVHRDVKPRNMFLTKRIDGRPIVKLLDYGLAKTVDTMNDRALTRTSAVMGSPQYMSPEQMRASRDVDARTDIWSLGACLYEMLVGVVPFNAETVPELCAMVLKDPPSPPQTLRPEIPPALAAAVLRCLEKDPARRFASAAELVTALEPFGTEASRGASSRVRVVAASVQPPAPEVEPPTPGRTGPAIDASPTVEALGDTRTAASFDPRPNKRESSRVMPIAAGIGGAVLFLAVVAIAAVALVGRRPPAPSAGADRVPAATLSATAVAPPSETPPPPKSEPVTPAAPPPTTTARAEPPPAPTPPPRAAAKPAGNGRRPAPPPPLASAPPAPVPPPVPAAAAPAPPKDDPKDHM